MALVQSPVESSIGHFDPLELSPESVHYYNQDEREVSVWQQKTWIKPKGKRKMNFIRNSPT
jgi:hypothetical protein